MKTPIASLIIKTYQMEDLINILLNNNYIIELEHNDENTVLITAYTKFEKEEEK